jgi:hypothetical protein
LVATVVTYPAVERVPGAVQEMPARLVPSVSVVTGKLTAAPQADQSHRGGRRCGRVTPASLCLLFADNATYRP